jgi:hypothetical protein
MKAYWGSGGIDTLILWPRHYTELSGQLHDPAALPPGKEPWYLNDYQLYMEAFCCVTSHTFWRSRSRHYSLPDSLIACGKRPYRYLTTDQTLCLPDRSFVAHDLSQVSSVSHKTKSQDSRQWRPDTTKTSGYIVSSLLRYTTLFLFNNLFSLLTVLIQN